MSKLVNMKQMLIQARDGKYAVAQININNLEWISAALDTAQETNTPLILGVSAGAGKYMCGFKNVVGMVTNMMDYKKISVPICLHLDHGSFENATDALAAGFSSVMFDGSNLPFDQNIAKTNEILQLANQYNASVEVEVGGIGGEEDGHMSCGELADVGQCQTMATSAQTKNIAALAAGIGNIHGVYPADWKGLNFARLEEIKQATNHIPLVLHGGTGIPMDQIQKAISLGVCKININTECQLAFAKATRQYIEDQKDLDTKAKGFDPRKLLKPGYLAIKEVILEKITMFGSKGKAN